MAGRAPVLPKKSNRDPIQEEERIRQRAHEIYLRREGQDGSELDDWLQAEDEIQAENKKG